MRADATEPDPEAYIKKYSHRFTLCHMVMF
jgi:hypothetical protein